MTDAPNNKVDMASLPYFLPSPNTSSQDPTIGASSALGAVVVGDGFTGGEIEKFQDHKHAESWHPSMEYTSCEISDLVPGPQAVTFMGRVANMFDVPQTPKSPRAAKGCCKLCVKDCDNTITVRDIHSSRTCG
jgi:hypothetical protein